MTENEAIKELKEAIDCCTSGEDEHFKEALGMGILAIEEIQQYIAIGTVEEIQSMKENGAFSGTELAQIASMQMKLKEYQSIGTIEELQALKLKEHNYDNCHNYTCRKKCEKDGYAKAIDEFAKRLKENSIRGAFEYKPNKKEPWHKVRAFCRVVGTRKIDEIAEQMKGGAE